VQPAKKIRVDMRHIGDATGKLIKSINWATAPRMNHTTIVDPFKRYVECVVWFQKGYVDLSSCGGVSSIIKAMTPPKQNFIRTPSDLHFWWTVSNQAIKKCNLADG
jgi:hypothetical protein